MTDLEKDPLNKLQQAELQPEINTEQTPEKLPQDKPKEQVVAPFSAKKVLVYIVNTILFFVYFRRVIKFFLPF